MYGKLVSAGYYRQLYLYCDVWIKGAPCSVGEKKSD